MASATLETFCCMSVQVEPELLLRLPFQSIPYNIVCIISSLLGMIGAVYQVLPSAVSSLPHRHRSIGVIQKAIINWLAMADFFAASGILLRSMFWLWRGSMILESHVDIILCAVFALWIRIFYTATYMWTLLYAIDVFLVCKQKSGNPILYHVITWTTSVFMSFIGLGTLYLPNFICHNGVYRVLPNYMLSYVPILCVMIVNPILYYISSKNVRVLLTGGLGQLTYLEHNLLAALKEKFFCIVLVFYVCWIPNIINGILLWGFWTNLPKNVILGVWFVMASLNPLQAILNSLVYKGWEGCDGLWKSLKTCMCCCCQEPPHPGLLIDVTSSDHQPSPERPTLSTNNNTNNHFD
ncbi:G-protein coupled receptor 143 [Parasteatoda tepidariorum]|uniref:G-protein coupled receptor 143 n=1 Tax=Parasteatoda tepidariorum TaxID=114398 RepID=UPI001C728FCF|nr:G-protein coupled receptor 143 [Parasteatoda tepidariorum]XP_042904106.1 G-protein coupled receptor 143 [Parasteatoda tepidariorum]